MTRRVVVVEDDPSVLDLVLELLDAEGIANVGFRDAVDALAGPDLASSPLVLLDLSLPRMSGEEAFAAIRAGHAEVPICILTGVSDIGQRAMSLGADAVVPKPFEIDHLVATVRRFLD